MEAPGEAVQQVLAAAREGRADQVQVLVESQPSLAEARDAAGVSAIMIALYHGQPQIARWIAGRRSDLDVFEASAIGDAERVRALTSADPAVVKEWSPDGFTALGLASFFGQFAVARLLIERGADVNAIGRNAGKYTPLTGAVTAAHPEVVAELLRHGADANYRYGPGYTPLHVAAANGNVEIVTLLLEAGARKDARTDDGQTPRDYALHREHPDVARMLQ
ncbi:MAG: ankyrin repeat domain-containing protein [Bacteroidales bacterium]